VTNTCLQRLLQNDKNKTEIDATATLTDTKRKDETEN
jgi:hypothetical protein